MAGDAILLSMLDVGINLVCKSCTHLVFLYDNAQGDLLPTCRFISNPQRMATRPVRVAST